jgi:hypothetical protein
MNNLNCNRAVSRAKVTPGASNTTKLAGNLPVSEVFSRQEFSGMGSPMVQGFGRDGLVRKAGRMTNFMFETSCPPVARSNAASGFQSQLGARTMTTVNTTPTPTAAFTGATPTSNTLLARMLHARTIRRLHPPKVAPKADTTVARQQAIENALSMALHYIRTTDTQHGIQAATGKAIRAVAMLKQSCTEQNLGEVAQ